MVGHVTITGLEGALANVRGVGAAAQKLNGKFLAFGSPEPYARFIETGRSSRQTRRAGPAWMFRDGVRETMAEAPQLLGAAIVAGTSATDAAIQNLERVGVQKIQAKTPVRTGRLRASVRSSTRGAF